MTYQAISSGESGCAKAELILSTSIIAWSIESRHLLCAVSDVPVKYLVFDIAFQVIIPAPHAVDYVVFNGVTCGPMHCPQHDISIDDDCIRYSLDPTSFFNLEFRIQDCLRLITHSTTLIINSVAGTAENSYERAYVISISLYWCRHMTRV